MARVWLAPTAAVVGAGASFAGARLGARANRAASAEATEQRELAARREEWHRRFTTALAVATGADRLTRPVGIAMLDELLASDLANDDDRRLVRTAMRALIAPPEGALGDDVDGTDVEVEDEVWSDDPDDERGDA